MEAFCKHFFRFIGLAAIICVTSGAFAQGDKYNIDSIKAKVQRLSSDTDKVSTLMDNIAGFDCDDSAKKLSLANDAKRLAESIKWHPGILRANREIASIYLHCEKNKDKGFEYYQMNVDLAQRDGDINNEALALEYIAGEYIDILEHKKALDYYNKILELKPSLVIASYVLGNMGETYKQIGDYGHALILLDSSLKLINTKKTHNAQDTSEMAALYLNKGDLYLDDLEPDMAFKEYQSVIKIASARDRLIETWGLIGVGNAYKMKKDYPHAIQYFQEALKVCQQDQGSNKFEEFQQEVKIKDQLANTYLETWELPQAQAYADSALSLAESQHYVGSLSLSNATLGKVYLKENKYDLAVAYLQKALEIANQTNDLEDKKEAYESLNKAYKAQGQWQQAYDAFMNYIDIRDTLHNIETVKEVTKTSLGYEFKQQKFADSMQTQVLFAKKIERQQMFTYSGFIGLVMVLLLAFFVYRSYVTQKKYNDLLAIEKKRHLAHIEAQSNILSDIADTQAHKIRGPISTILGLVHIFNYEDLTDPMNKQVMEWITSTTEKLDIAVKEVIIKENNLRTEHEEDGIDEVRSE